MAKKNNWDFSEMQATLVKDTEQTISRGYQQLADGGNEQEQRPAAPVQQTEQEPAPQKTMAVQEQTKGVQTYIPMSQYKRMNAQKIERNETLGNLFNEAIALWLDVQEGKKKIM